MLHCPTLHRIAPQYTAMPPKRELSIRLAAHLREALDQAATSQGRTITSIVEDALAAQMGVDGPEQGHPTLADRVRMLEARVAALEDTATRRTAPPRDTTQGTATQRSATPPPRPPQTAAVTGDYPTAAPRPARAKPAPSGDLLTTTEAWEHCKAKGYNRAKNTFRKWANEPKNAAELRNEYGLEYLGKPPQGDTSPTYRKVR